MTSSSGLDYAFPGSVKIGGIASGATQPGGNALYLGHQLFDNGVVGVAMSGALAVDTVVAQGCRPIGWPLQVTSCTKNILEEVDGSAPFEVLRQIYAKSNERDQQLFRQSLFVGVAMDEFNDSPQLGDFKIRNIIGVNEKNWNCGRGRGAERGADRAIPSQGQRDSLPGPQRSPFQVFRREHGRRR